MNRIINHGRMVYRITGVTAGPAINRWVYESVIYWISVADTRLADHLFWMGETGDGRPVSRYTLNPSRSSPRFSQNGHKLIKRWNNICKKWNINRSKSLEIKIWKIHIILKHKFIYIWKGWSAQRIGKERDSLVKIYRVYRWSVIAVLSCRY